MVILRTTWEVVTPLYLAGAAPERPELRGPSLRGALRAWYRAIDPSWRDRERRWFGSADDDGGGSPWSLRLKGDQGLRADFQLDRDDYRQYRRGSPPNQTNGVPYAGYSLIPSKNGHRLAFRPSEGRSDATFAARLVVPRPERLGDEGFQALAASAWLLGHLGGVGARANRGFGGAQLVGWELEGEASPGWRSALEALPLARSARTPPDAAEALRQALPQLKRWFGATKPDDELQTPRLGDRAVVRLGRSKSGDAFPSWHAALDDAAWRMQAFRRQKLAADRRGVLEHLMPRGKKLTVASRRVVFGLPIEFQYRILPKGTPRLPEMSLIWVPRRSDRWASPIRLRVLRIGAGYLSVVTRLDAVEVGSSDPGDEADPALSPKVGGRRGDLVPVDRGGDVLADFMRSLEGYTTVFGGSP